MSSPSLTEMIQGLAEGEMLIYEKYREIKLTDKGNFDIDCNKESPWPII